MCFFFQAEDGIRDLVRSRGLGDVYKRQDAGMDPRPVEADVEEVAQHDRKAGLEGEAGIFGAVSYTHLTLPTSDLV